MLANLAASGVRARVSSFDKVFSGAAGFLWEGWILQIRYMSSDNQMQCLCLLFISLHFLQSFHSWSFYFLFYFVYRHFLPIPKNKFICPIVGVEIQMQALSLSLILRVFY